MLDSGRSPFVGKPAPTRGAHIDDRRGHATGLRPGWPSPGQHRRGRHGEGPGDGPTFATSGAPVTLTGSATTTGPDGRASVTAAASPTGGAPPLTAPGPEGRASVTAAASATGGASTMTATAAGVSSVSFGADHALAERGGSQDFRKCHGRSSVAAIEPEVPDPEEGHAKARDPTGPV